MELSQTRLLVIMMDVTLSEMDKWCYMLSERHVGIQLALWLGQNEMSKKHLKMSPFWQCPEWVICWHLLPFRCLLCRVWQWTPKLPVYTQKVCIPIVFVFLQGTSGSAGVKTWSLTKAWETDVPVTLSTKYTISDSELQALYKSTQKRMKTQNPVKWNTCMQSDKGARHIGSDLTQLADWTPHGD